MNHFDDPPRRPERFWLHKSQWRTVAALMLLLAAVVASLAMASGFWWAMRSHQTRAAAPPTPAPPAPVATVTIPIHSASVVEVYPLTVVHPPAPRMLIRSPGGIVAELPIRIGQRVSAGQMLARLEQPVGPAEIARTPIPVAPSESLTRERAEAERLRQRLEQVRAEIGRVQASRTTTEHANDGDASHGRAGAQQAEANVERAQRLLTAATERRRHVDQQYEDRRVSRFQFHLARSREILAQVELRHAEELAETARQTLAGAATPAEDRTADRKRKPVARLEAEARGIETRLARVHLRVAGTRQRLVLPSAKPQVKTATARAPRSGIVAAVWAKAGEKLPRGAPLAALDPPVRPRLRARVGREALPSFRPGARVTIQEGSGRTLNGRVARVVREADGAALVEVVPPRNMRIGPGAALVPPRASPGAPVLPADALAPSPGKPVVWLAVPLADGSNGWIARRQAVRVAPAGKSHVAVLAGLHPGDRVIVAGASNLHEGQRVAPVEISPLATE